MRRVAAAFLLAIATAPPAGAAPDEIQVYDDAADAKGEAGVDLHVNYVISGATEPSYPGELPPNHVLQTTPEFSYGFGRGLEGGLYFPVAFAPGGLVVQNGLRPRLKYIHPRPEGAPWFWGINGELGYTNARVSESEWNLEIRPIVGWRKDAWLVVVNPILGAPLSGSSRRPELAPCLKVGYDVAPGWQTGVEHYSEFGPVGEWLPPQERVQQTYAAADYAGKRWGLNFGVGYGWTDGSDRWVVKAIVALPL